MYIYFRSGSLKAFHVNPSWYLPFGNNLRSKLLKITEQDVGLQIRVRVAQSLTATETVPPHLPLSPVSAYSLVSHLLSAESLLCGFFLFVCFGPHLVLIVAGRIFLVVQAPQSQSSGLLGIEPVFPALQGGFLTTRPPGKSSCVWDGVPPDSHAFPST